MNKQKGFTLIELVMVIVILGILAATALPKFLNMRKDAVLATMNNLEAAMQSAAILTYSQALIKGIENESNTTITINGQNVDIVYGYPAGTEAGIGSVIELDADDWNNNDRDGEWHSRASVYSGAWIYWHGSYDENAGSLACYLRYRQPTRINTRSIIDSVITEC